MGKAIARYNATKHGLLSREVLLTGEDEEALKELDEALRAELQPEGAMENLLADRIIAAHWRLRRLGRVEAGIFAYEWYGGMTERARMEANTYTRDLMDFVSAIDITVSDEQKHQEALSKAKEMKAAQDAETATLGRTFIRDADKANAFSKLSRYETTIERSFHRALHELQRLKAARRADNASPPPAIDVGPLWRLWRGSVGGKWVRFAKTELGPRTAATPRLSPPPEALVLARGFASPQPA